MHKNYHFQANLVNERIEARFKEAELSRLAKVCEQKDDVRRVWILTKVAPLKNIAQIGQNWLGQRSRRRAFRQAITRAYATFAKQYPAVD